jgi:LAS superfamily LD-carboxypeptidase LdcB
MFMRTLFSLSLIALTIACSPNQNQEEKQVVAVNQEETITADSTKATYLNKDYLMGKFDPSTHQDFSKIASQYTEKEEIYMRKDAYEAFVQMAKHAKSDGITFEIVSATRPFQYQKGIWERKWNGQTKVSGQDLSQTMPGFHQRAMKILEYSSMPGTSRHHWGTDIDLNHLENDYFESGQGLKEYEWLVEHAASYGFCQVYSEKGADRPHGYNLEKWHWSYLPVAGKLTEFARTNMNNSDIFGFEGDSITDSIDILQKYILGINPNCN